MTLNILFAASKERWPEYAPSLKQALEHAGIAAHLSPDIAPELVDYIVFAPNGPVTDFSVYPRAKAILSLWAGVEKIVGNKTIKLPLTRMVDSGLSEGMVEWVTGHVLRYHLGIDAQLAQQDGVWSPAIPPLARNRKVGILGLGELGSACANALRDLNFDVAGWSRSPKHIQGITCLSGPIGLAEILARSEILVLLLPLTDATQNILDAQAFNLMPDGARVLNPGRGALIDDDALLDALNSGKVAHATLDVFRTEPLPAAHPFWAHPSVTVTPHIASETRADTASQVIAENIRRFEAGETPKYLVDFAAGY